MTTCKYCDVAPDLCPDHGFDSVPVTRNDPWLQAKAPSKIELAQDSYYYGTAADFDSSH